MTAHRRAWTLRAGLVALLAAGGLFGIASPAFAADAYKVVIKQQLGDFHPGDSQQLLVEVTNVAEGPTQTITVSVTGLGSDFTVGTPSGDCQSANNNSCKFKLDTPTSKADLAFPIQAKNTVSVPPGGSSQVSATVKATDGFGGNDVEASSNTVKLFGPSQQQQPTAVTQVSGFVKDVATGQAISGATVTLQDSAGHNFTTSTSSLGAFTFKSNQNNPIAPGTLAIGAQKTGYADVTASANVQAGQSFTFPELRMESTASAAPSTAPSVPIVAPPSNDVSVAPLGNDTASGSGGGSGFSLILIVAGALLVLLGIGAIVLILMRRRRDGDDELEDEDGPSPRRGPSPVPASRGNYRGAPDATAPIRRGGQYGDPTMVGRGPSLADAPTTIHRPVPADEYPDPYGAPPPPPRSAQPTYGGGGYGGGQQYGDNEYGAGGYGDRRGGGQYGGETAPYSGIYGQPEEPTRGYESGGYDSPGPHGGGYDAPPPRSGGGYGAGSGYDDRGGGYQPRGGGAYDEPTSPGGHRDSGGYGAGGSRGGYPPADEYDEPRYDRRGNPPPPESRGRLDWLDD